MNQQLGLCRNGHIILQHCGTMYNVLDIIRCNEVHKSSDNGINNCFTMGGHKR